MFQCTSMLFTNIFAKSEAALRYFKTKMIYQFFNDIEKKYSRFDVTSLCWVVIELTHDYLINQNIPCLYIHIWIVFD